MPVPPVRCVDRKFRCAWRNLYGPRSQQELPGPPVENEDIDALIERQNQRGLRAVNHKARGALRRAGLEEGRDDVVATRTNRKDRSNRNIVFKIGRSIERIDRDAERRRSIENLRQFRLFGQNGCNRRSAQRVAHHLVGGNIDILLQIAIGIDAAMSSGDAGQWSIGNEVGKIDRCHRKRLDHSGDRGPVRRVLHRAIEMRTQGHAFVHGRSPVSALCGAIPKRRAGQHSAHSQHPNLPN